MLPPTLETIYEELKEVKHRLERLEKEISLREEELPPDELKELQQTSREMEDGRRIRWKP